MEDQLIVTIDYETAPRADDLGELFTALARDYKDMTKGRLLVVSSIEHGSIIATLTDWALQAAPFVKDAVEFAKGAKALADFGKLLKDWINGAKAGEPKKLPYRRGRKTLGQRSVEAIVKMAAENGRAVRVKHTSAKGDTLEVEMSAPQAIELREAALADQTKVVEVKDVPDLEEARVALPSLRHALGRLSDPHVNLSSGEAQAIIDAVFEALQAAGLTYLIPHIAADLSSRGMHTLASALLAKAHTTDGDHEPPLTTT